MSGPRDLRGRPAEIGCDGSGSFETGDAPGGVDPTSSGLDAVGPSPDAVLGRVPTGTSLHRELAAAARSRGHESGVRREVIELCHRLSSTPVPSVDIDAARQRVADAGGEEERLKERVAALRGDVRARRAVDAETGDALSELRSAAAALANAQTDRIAAEQALDRARARSDRARDAHERRLELRDRLENRRREGRDELARAVYPTFRDALSAVPGVVPADAGPDPSAYDGPRLAASLAAVRIADVDGPIAIGEAAAAWLDERGWRDEVATVVDAEVVR